MKSEANIDGARLMENIVVPRGRVTCFQKWLRQDVLSGFFIFLIALPLCLGIAAACGFPPVAGLITAVVGGLLTPFISNSELTIKGPPAGLIVVVFGAMESFGFTMGLDPTADFSAYRMTLAIGCIAGLVQMAFAALRVGKYSDFFPPAVVHGMLASIGCIIVLKQLPVVFGEKAEGEPLEILSQLPARIHHINPEIAAIGLLSLCVLFGVPLAKSWLKQFGLKRIPAPLLVLLLAVPMGMYFDLSHEHTYSFLGHEYPIGEAFLVSIPHDVINAITTPDFNVFVEPTTRLTACRWVMIFAIIGSVESLLSAKAIDVVDPWKRKTSMDRDLLSVGVGNIVASSIGGLPMISEIVRSKANIDNGGHTRFANFWHAIFLLAFIVSVPALIHRIPLAALAAMLVYTGYRLASPREFINVFEIGPEQLAIFVITIVGVLSTDLLMGVGIGVAAKFLVHVINGVPPKEFLKPFLQATEIDETTVQINAAGSAVFSNWIPFRRQIEQIGLVQRNNVIVNLAGTRLIDSNVMEKLDELQCDFFHEGLSLEIIGLDNHQPFSRHRHATRRLPRQTAAKESAPV